MTEIDVELNYVPRKWQREAHIGLSKKRWGVLVVHRRGGKSVLAIMQLIHRACTIEKENARFAYIAPLYKQAKAIAWSYLKHYALKIPGAKISEAELHVTLPNGANLRLYGADNADALRGIYLDGVVLDEVAQLSKELWDSVLRPALADREGWALLMGTPNGINLLSEVYYSAMGNDSWYHGLFTINDTESLPPKEVSDLKSEMSNTAFAREFLCDFSAAADNVLLSVEVVEAACNRQVKPGTYDYAPKILGVDIARQGDDRSALIRKQGRVMFGLKTWQGADAMAMAANVANEILEWEPDAVFIDGSGGYGAGVIDRLRQLGHSPIEVQFGSSPKDPRYSNLRTEMWMELANWVRDGGSMPNTPEVKLDLCAPTYTHANAAGKMALEPKDKIKARGLPSPDVGDAMALCFAYPVAAKPRLGDKWIQANNKSALMDYDPLAALR